ncbi:MAG: DUF4191 domain-containing protein [Actinomycetaceae bacterium]|nr:DUF4191 domain-containing protein [Actinomycetaceae bacterium]
MAKNTANKNSWWRQIRDIYRITKQTYSWIGWALLGTIVAGIALGVLLGITTGHWITYPLILTLAGITVALFLLSRYAKKAQYQQIANYPGAGGMVLSTLGNGWNTSQEPVRINRDRDTVFRAIGRPGVVLVAEGPKKRVYNLVQQERKSINRTAGKEVPITVLYVGDGSDGTVTIDKLERTVKKLPKALTRTDVSNLIARLDRLQRNAMPIPKGIDPMKVRPSRRSMR